jgi:ribosome-binding factor A
MVRRRAKRVGKFIQKEISEIIQRELKDPRIGFVTVTDVDVSEDLRYAKIFVTVLQKGQITATLTGLEHAKGFIRNEIARRMKLRFTPEIVFQLDTTAEKGAHIEEVLRSIKERDNE